ncbi:sugar transporter [Chitinophaga sp. G-6-1-13]|uniref:Sugar transporter n=1 Tax=Chitinophaga fulva TaxID=2728842 RepID=A0A848GKN0_9BACT|nr:sugar transporter [Chitinophaga fulva]NML37260.1 sugar transporter [Chitinophaga fulva]
METSRIHKSLLNARVSLVFYLLTLLLSFFSRSIFLHYLGADFLGLTGTVSNLLGFLNLAEMGVGAAIGFMLYKPLFERNHQQIAEIVSLMGGLCRRIGYVVLAAGILLSAFLPLFFSKEAIPLGVIFTAYYAFLISSLIGYFINYREILLMADQRNYVVTAYFQTAGIAKVLLQMAIAFYFGSLYAWIVVELLFSVLLSLILNWKINKVYPWLHTDPKKGTQLFRQYPQAGEKIRQLFIHKISDFTLYSTRDMFIYAFTSLSMVAYYGNYMVIIWKLNQLMLTALGSIQAGIGNLVAENHLPKTIRVFWEIVALRYFSSAVFVFSVYHLIEPFIVLWIGTGYLLKKRVLFLILCNIFLMQVRGPAINFLQAYGLFADTMAPVTEALMNITISIGLGYRYGIEGVLLGSIASMLLIGCIWKPIYLFRKGFSQPVWNYWKETIKYLVLIGLSWWLGSYLLYLLQLPDPATSLSRWIFYAMALVTAYSLLLGTFFYTLKGSRDLIQRVILYFNKRGLWKE